MTQISWVALKRLFNAKESLLSSTKLVVEARGFRWEFDRLHSPYASHTTCDVTAIEGTGWLVIRNRSYAIAIAAEAVEPPKRALKPGRSRVVKEWQVMDMPGYVIQPVLNRVRGLIPAGIDLAAGIDLGDTDMVRMAVEMPMLAWFGDGGEPVYWVAQTEEINDPLVIDLPPRNDWEIDRWKGGVCMVNDAKGTYTEKVPTMTAGEWRGCKLELLDDSHYEFQSRPAAFKVRIDEQVHSVEGYAIPYGKYRLTAQELEHEIPDVGENLLFMGMLGM